MQKYQNDEKLLVASRDVTKKDLMKVCGILKAEIRLFNSIEPMRITEGGIDFKDFDGNSLINIRFARNDSLNENKRIKWPFINDGDIENEWVNSKDIIIPHQCVIPLRFRLSNKFFTFTDSIIVLIEESFKTIGIYQTECLERPKWELYELYIVCALVELIERDVRMIKLINTLLYRRKFNSAIETQINEFENDRMGNSQIRNGKIRKNVKKIIKGIKVFYELEDNENIYDKFITIINKKGNLIEDYVKDINKINL